MSESSYQCRECGITHIEPGIEVDGQRLCWADADLCSRCQDALAAELLRDATRYRYLRSRSTTVASLFTGGVFAGRIPQNTVLGGEDLDRAVDAEMGEDVPAVTTLELRLADCLADAIDTPVMTVKDTMGGADMALRLGAFLPEISERAAELLDEAGR